MSKRSRLLAVGAVVTATGLVAAGVTVANAAAAPPPLAFVAATNALTAERYVDESGEAWLYLQLGTHVIAGKDPLEIRVNRTAYSKPLVAKRAVWTGGKKTWQTLPAGMVTDFTGLKSFTKVTIKNKAGAVVQSYDQDYCPNAYDTGRTRPDAPSDNPYPVGCADAGGNPFWLGAVWGVQAGWSSPTDNVGRWGGGANVDVPAGEYTVDVAVNKNYVDFFKIPAKSSKASMSLTVTQEEAEEGEEGLAETQAKLRAKDGAPPAVASEHDEHAAEGDPKRQVSAFSADLRPPARRPTTFAAAPSKGPKPDLKSLPAWGIELDKESEAGKTYVNFGATVWNGGTSPLVVDGFRRTGTELMDAYQYFFDANGKQVGSTAAGTMEWDKREGHMHWHFTDFAQYRLLKADKKVAVISGKEAFCLANTDAVDYTIPNAKWRPSNTDLSTSCGQNTSVAVRQVLDVGGGDTYGQSLPGQSFDVTDLPNGTYYIEVLANPEKKLAEVSTANNSSLRKVVLGGTKANRTLTVPPHEGITG
ncbi:lysyl oxidase family protein [Spirilliplanes yamanashiensis]|uniref:Lysyl oxidase n=1 Tax=Spirilliplanes yamanashiensis TaxID=42233 RepID=A0A8J3YAN9_9ACTN|nr:lysyl oxidase family protein [Spirilliplanes yamanashiensis]MDP9816023.1 hypothetical protein [Spirilliplanes yamanashiensis]GIJ04283.1 hypothetical protein Sya03_36350 [Spirilliplanes yamanashiensis]